MMMSAIYDKIGLGYARKRKPDYRIARAIHDALGDAQSILNVGAGTGSYEPDNRTVTALEPSAEMIGQRPPDAAKAYQGSAEAIPFADNQFDAAMAVLTVHHWSDFKAGLREMRRVAKGPLVILTFDPESHYFWLADYIPEIIALDQPIMPKLEAFERILGPCKVEVVPVPHDCTDGFLGAYWQRPHAYLDPEVRAAISTFAKLDNITNALTKLEQDLASGAWEERYGHLMELKNLDVGYRLVVAQPISKKE
ncbi:class I SAM-dependent methyltransferase [Sphingorhabdus sp. YGSMI21]|uniref:class I SAM-dependent methyltransferase n=1 Tax=Sphingorhabdus sp. YGSMI21 TaxID=2077182 RepID=UPI001F0CDB80|nr:class I SAM-dependent methyltransferase [Sphingorhabdus sp. YGSMI21]